MKIGFVLVGLLTMLGTALASTAVVYSPDQKFDSAQMLKERGYTVKTLNQKFGLEELKNADILFVDAGINDIPPEMYVIFREYAVQGGRVVIALDPASVKNYYSFNRVDTIDPSLCYSEPSPTKKFQYCTETKILGQELVTGRAYSAISEYQEKTEAVPLESGGAPLAYVGDQETAVRNYMGQGEIIIAGFQYSSETRKFFEKALFPGKTSEKQGPVLTETENQENENIVAKPAPTETEKRVTGETIVSLANKKQEGKNVLPMITILIGFAGILGYFIITKQAKPQPKTTKNKPAEIKNKQVLQTKITEHQPQQPQITLPPKEKDEFIY